MTIIRPSLEEVKKLYAASLPDFDYLLRSANSKDGWIRFSPKLYELISIMKCSNYPELYQDENRIQTALFRAFTESDKEIKERYQCFENFTELEQQQFVDDLLQDSTELSAFIDTNTLHLDDLDWSAVGQKKAMEDWEKLSFQEQKQVIRFSRYSLIFCLSSFYNYLSVMVHGRKLTLLVTEAMAENDDSFRKAVHIDKSILEHIPFFKQRYKRALQEGDTDFLELLNYRIQSPQLKGKVRHPLLYMLFSILEGTYWLDDLSHPDLLKICDEFGLGEYKHQNRIESVPALTKRLKQYREFQKFNALSTP